MQSEAEIRQFALELQQSVIGEASLEGAEELQHEVFTRMMIDDLMDLGEVEDAQPTYHNAHGIEISGWGTANEGATLDLYATIYRGSGDLATLAKGDVEKAFKRLEALVDKCDSGYWKLLEPASPAFDMARGVADVLASAERLRYFLFTDGVTTVAPEVVLDPTPDGVLRSRHVWDLQRVYRTVYSGRDRAPIEIDFIERYGEALPCLPSPDVDPEYRAFLAVIPGEILYDLYAEFGQRLLERNVRAFLQARGKVNKGMRETILNRPERFLAYNNGISATAASVELDDEGAPAIRRLVDLQIVNGGQTTASLHLARHKDKADLSRIAVQAKISVVDPGEVEDLVPLISRYANSQNKVSDADLSSNHPFHVAIERLSRAIWAPAQAGTSEQTQWFYERARGSYQNAIAKAGTPARQRQFRRANPTAQKFTKTDIAKFENTWDQRPQKVSLGAEKNFYDFMARLAERPNFEPDQRYFERLVAKGILFRRTEKIVGRQDWKGYRANIVTYTLALISNRTMQCVDLERIWREQDISPALEAAIEDLCPMVREVLLAAPGSGNVSEWAKKDACWARMQKLDWQLPATLDDELLARGNLTSTTAVASIDAPSGADAELIKEIADIDTDVWGFLAHWGKETDNLSPQARKFAVSLKRQLDRGKSPSIKQARWARSILDEATGLGFRAPEY